MSLGRIGGCGCGGCGCGKPDSAVVAAALELLGQCEGIVRQVPDRAYTGVSAGLDGGSVGKHVRHTMDHYAAIVRTLSEGGAVDYDHRERDVPMERDRVAALASIDAVKRSVRSMRASDLDRGVTIRVMTDAAGTEALLASSLGREVAFATHHAVHHLAMIKSIAREFGFTLAEGVGRAPSTLNHEQAAGGGASRA